LVLNRLIEVSPEKSEQQTKTQKLYVGLGMSYSAFNKYEKSKEAFEKTLAINSELLEKEPENVFYLEDRAVTLEEYANLLLKTGRNAEADIYNAESAEIYQKIEAKEPKMMTLRRNIVGF
ncbi:MAG: tetratricopeptide repeat protein, partial [Methanosarcina sp.]